MDVEDLRWVVKSLVGMEGLRLVEWVGMGVEGVLELIWGA